MDRALKLFQLLVVISMGIVTMSAPAAAAVEACGAVCNIATCPADPVEWCRDAGCFLGFCWECPLNVGVYCVA